VRFVGSLWSWPAGPRLSRAPSSPGPFEAGGTPPKGHHFFCGSVSLSKLRKADHRQRIASASLGPNQVHRGATDDFHDDQGLSMLVSFPNDSAWCVAVAVAPPTIPTLKILLKPASVSTHYILNK